jgi:hypothetical protein
MRTKMEINVYDERTYTVGNITVSMAKATGDLWLRRKGDPPGCKSCEIYLLDEGENFPEPVWVGFPSVGGSVYRWIIKELQRGCCPYEIEDYLIWLDAEGNKIEEED